MKKKIKNNKKPANSSNLKELKSVIVNLCNATIKPRTFKDICKELQVKDKIAKHQTSFIIKNLIVEGSIKEVRQQKYGAISKKELYEGKIEKMAAGEG